MTLTRLVGKNLQRHSRSYTVYFFSLVFSVMVYYSFATLSHDAYLQHLLAENQELQGPFRGGGFFIVLFVLMFMLTVTNFFVRNRQKELGLYHLLGMRKYQIGGLFFLEQVLVGVVSLATGLLAGLVFTRLFALILLKVLGIETDSPFLFSWQAVSQTLKMFLPILFFASLRGLYVVYRYPLIELFDGQRRHQLRKKPGPLSWALGLLGVGLVSYGYYQAVHFVAYVATLEARYGAGRAFFLAMLFILSASVLGTYLIFKGFLPLVLTLLSWSPRFYYQKLRLMTVAKLQFYLKDNARTLGTTAVLLGTALAALTGAAALYVFAQAEVALIAPVEIILDEGAQGTHLAELKAAQLERVGEVELKVTGAYDPAAPRHEARLLSLVAFSQYEALTRLLKGTAPLPVLGPQEGLLLQGAQHLAQQESPAELYVAATPAPIKVTATQLDILGGSRHVRYNTEVLVLADTAYEALSAPLVYRLGYFDSVGQRQGLPATTFDKLSRGLPQETFHLSHDYRWQQQQVVGTLVERELQPGASMPTTGYLRNASFARQPLWQTTRQTYGLVVYIAVFLGVVFFVATASIMAVKQLTEFSQGRDDYQLLLKLGVSPRAIRRSIYWQNGLIFFAPLLLAATHAYFALAAFKSLLGARQTPLTWLISGCFLVLYVFFYHQTSRSCYRLVTAT